MLLDSSFVFLMQRLFRHSGFEIVTGFVV